MSVSEYFSKDYGQARKRFIDASKQAGAAMSSYQCPSAGPDGEVLTTDVAWHGEPDAERVLVTISATHGAEGFCGSGVQIGWLDSGLYQERPDGIALLQIHAINPHGFAWLRRVTEDNIDLNRNFVDHSGPYPENSAYDELAEVICPTSWDDATIADTHKTLRAYADSHGEKALQSAISGGQYSHADGLFFGGNSVAWSQNILMEVLSGKLSGAKQVAVIDYHTGLGPRGHGERICCHSPESNDLKRAMDWYDEDVTSPLLGTSSSVELHGVNVFGMEKCLPGADLTVVALEYGTQSSPEVNLALRADNWLHLHGDPMSKKGREIKQQIRDAFYQDADDWKSAIWARAVETQKMAFRGLSEG
ncbi:M14 family metallopeptidase [Pelagibius sp. Alg239-R121]|uniref:M14 family metallopeptidase n=1 Tax=Pelagibius sp. Alg239-R121 TaxID=2993448 RepID=UPI0024A7447E|nr:M14 family metallopeptidase [Pelagibius sp. Alg239-R121]